MAAAEPQLKPVLQKPILQKPPGYRDPTFPVQPARRPQPRKPVLPPSFHPKKKRRSCCRICCCCACIILFIFFLLFIVTAGLFYLWFDPKFPVYHLQSFRIPRFNVTVKSDGTYLDAETVTRLEVRNPNGKLTYYYGGTQVMVTVGADKGTDLGSTRLRGFTQGKKNTTSLKAVTKVSGVLIDDGVGSRLKARFRTKDLVVNVEVRTRVGLGVERLKLGSVGVNVFCDGVRLKRIEGGDMPKCTINILRWFNIH